MKLKNYNLLVVAHPDDESLFFAGLLMQKSRNKARSSRPWKVILMTDANADGHGRARLNQFKKATRMMKVKYIECWQYPDIYEKRLPVEEICLRLMQENPKQVYTHGIIGEYGHPHHQDVSYATHLAFPNISVRSVAYNCYPTEVIELSNAQYKLKTKILSEVYLEETRRFSNFLPATSTENFVEVSFKEVQALYEFFTHGKKPNLQNLKTYRWYWPYLVAQKRKTLPRPF